ncbi:MAG: PAS domain S-box protein, partial [Burkholderiales bacterium]|nr:PAS domain S-box protein [Burkholderiales bacterium]
ADRKAYVEILNRDGRVSDHELRLRRKDGSVMWVILNGTIVPFGAEELIVAWTYDVTERHRRAERMRLAAEQEQKTILDTSPVGIGFFTDQRMVHCNQMLVSLFGYPDLAALQARPLPTLLADPDDLPRLAKEAVQHFDAGGRYQGEWLTVRADGTPFWAQLTAMRLPDTGGDRTALWMVEDITERRQREQTLADREALLRVLLESSPAGLALATPGGELRYATPLWSEMFGYDVESFKGLTAAVLYSDPADRVGFTELLQRDGRVVDREKMAKRRDGSTFWARVSATPVRIGGEDLIAVWVQDSTQRRLYDEQLAAAQEALRVAVEEHRAIFETSAQGVGLLKDRVILRCNRRMEEIFGYEPGALVGRGTRILYDSDEAYELAGRGYNQAIRGETNVREQRMMRSDGSLFWCRITGRAMVPGDPGRGFVISYEDVNDQHAAIVAIRAMNEEQLAIFAAVTSGIALIKDRSIRSCNAKLEEIFGYAAGEFRGKPTRLWYATDEAHAAIGREIRDDFSRGATHRSEREVVRKDGTPFWCRFSGRLLDPADPDKGAVWMVEDVTEEREAAAALLHAKELAEEATRA